MDIHDMRARSEAGNKYLIAKVDRATKFMFAYPPPNKTAKNVAKKLLELLVTFGIPLSLRSDPGTEFTAEVVQHFCKWLNMTIDYGPTDHPRAQGAVERLGGRSVEPSWNLQELVLAMGQIRAASHLAASGNTRPTPARQCHPLPLTVRP